VAEAVGGHVFGTDFLTAAFDGYRAEVRDGELGGSAVFSGAAIRTRRQLLEHFFEHFCALESNFPAFFGRRAAKDVDADFHETNVGFLVLCSEGAVGKAKVQETQNDEHGGGETDEVDGFAFVEGLDFASAEGLVETQDFAGAVEAGGAGVCEAAV